MQHSALWDSEIPIRPSPGPTSQAGHSHISHCSLWNYHPSPVHDCALLPPKAHALVALGLPGAHTILCEIQLISPGTAFVFKTAKCQLRHKNAERSRLLLCWRGGSCSSGLGRHWGVSWGAGARHDSVTPKLWGDCPQGQQLPLCKDSKRRTETPSELRATEPQNHSGWKSSPRPGSPRIANAVIYSGSPVPHPRGL